MTPDDIESGEVWPLEVHWSSCDGLCGEPGGCWDDDYDSEQAPHDGWGNVIVAF
jgi:hypothetical protein